MAVIDIANEYLEKVRPSGPDQVVALCPFHEDNSPSFRMNTVNGLYICYACGEKGNLRQFLMRFGMTSAQIERKHGLTVKEAQRAKKQAPDPLKPNVVSNDPLPEEFLGLFSKDYPTALLNAGFEEETLEFFQVGFDKHHMRITYPIRDLEGNLVGISGRAIEDDYGRYKVYDKEYTVWGLPERHTPKSSYLWNGHNFMPFISFNTRPKRIVLVEGYKACMWVWQSGIKEVSALQGAKMSKDQKWILQRLGCPVYMMLDNNEAGYEATDRIGYDLTKSLPVRIVQYEAEQPDGLEMNCVLDSVNSAKDYYQVLLDQS